MKVYRVVHKQELENILNNNVESLGREFAQYDDWANTHVYEKGKRYLHFFYNKNACQHFFEDIVSRHIVINKAGRVEDYYICTFDIPIKNLLTHTGRGTYHALGIPDHGYDQVLKRRFEAAIDVDNFDTSWLVMQEPLYCVKYKNKYRLVYLNDENEKGLI